MIIIGNFRLHKWKKKIWRIMDEIEEENRRRSFFYGRKRDPRLQFYGRRYFPHQSPLSVLIGRKKDSNPGNPVLSPKRIFFARGESHCYRSRMRPPRVGSFHARSSSWNARTTKRCEPLPRHLRKHTHRVPSNRVAIVPFVAPTFTSLHRGLILSLYYNESDPSRWRFWPKQE